LHIRGAVSGSGGTRGQAYYFLPKASQYFGFLEKFSSFFLAREFLILNSAPTVYSDIGA
jgi:hypothetical protein